MKQLNVPQSGSQANTTASRNRFGQYLRNRSMPTQPRTAAQVAVRSSLANFSQLWKTLTDAQRLAWSAYADSHPRTNSLGVSIKLTGSMAYTGVNNALAIAGRPSVSDAPTYDTVENPTFTLLTNQTDDLTFTIGASDPLAYTVVSCSPPRSPGVSFNNDYRFVGVFLNDDTVTTSVALLGYIEAKYGTYVFGAKYFIRWYHINGFGVTDAFQSLSWVVPLT